MPIEITIPRLGWSMDEGTFGEWLKADGDLVEPGDPIFTMESEKALQEVESVDGGILRIAPGAPQEGDLVTVGLLVAWLMADGEAVPDVDVSRKAAAPQSSVPPPDGLPPAASPSVRRLAREVGVDLRDIDSAGPISAGDVRRLAEAKKTGAPTAVASRTTVPHAAAPIRRSSHRRSSHVPDRNSAPGLPAISPRAVRLAKQTGIDWPQLTGSGRDGRIRECDVRTAAAQSLTQSWQQQPGVGRELPAQRRLIAKRMISSLQNTAPVTLTSRADATQLVSLRDQYKAQGDTPVPAYHDIVAKLVALTLKQHPVMNSVWTDDGLIQSDDVHICLAVDTEAGLLVPVVRHVDQLSLLEVARQSSDLIQRARQRKCTADELSPGTFTITNLGQFGIGFFTPIINSPQTAILGLGIIRREAVVVDNNRIEPRDQISVSLTFDHQVTDGAPAARFLEELCRRIENTGPGQIQ